MPGEGLSWNFCHLGGINTYLYWINITPSLLKFWWWQSVFWSLPCLCCSKGLTLRCYRLCSQTCLGIYRSAGAPDASAAALRCWLPSPRSQTRINHCSLVPNLTSNLRGWIQNLGAALILILQCLLSVETPLFQSWLPSGHRWRPCASTRCAGGPTFTLRFSQERIQAVCPPSLFNKLKSTYSSTSGFP